MVYHLATIAYNVVDRAFEKCFSFPDETLRQLTEEFWNWKLSTFPEFATAEGFHMHDDTLEMFGLEYFRYRKVSPSQWCYISLVKN